MGARKDIYFLALRKAKDKGSRSQGSLQQRVEGIHDSSHSTVLIR